MADEQNQDQQDSQQGESNQSPQQLREFAERQKQRADANEAAARELAFIRAKVDTDSNLGKYLMGTYTGDLTPDAITAWAAEVGAPMQGASTPTDDGRPDPEEQRRQARDAHLAAEQARTQDTPPADGTQQTPPDPWVEGYKGFQEAMANGATREDAAAHVIQRAVVAAKNGDERALWTGFSPEEQEQAKSR